MSQIESAVQAEQWHKEPLAIVVIGASGDLAKKKTYPSLFNLWLSNLLPKNCVIYGYARSSMTDEAFRKKIFPFLAKNGDEQLVMAARRFLESLCFYGNGASYSDQESFARVKTHLDSWFEGKSYNKLFYFAIPPTAFGHATSAVHGVFYLSSGRKSSWLRIIVEKPFGRDLRSCLQLGEEMSSYFSENHLFRIDHYLGKEMVQNLLVFRFGNIYFEQLLNREKVARITISFKEDIGTQGRGGYFDNFGIIRDIIQNHLIQVLSLLTMEAPVRIDGKCAGKHIRDAKVALLKAIIPPSPDDCLLGQYRGYLDDETISNKQSACPTFAVIIMSINNPRWAGVPIVLKAGKALDERKVEISVQFKKPPAGAFLFGHEKGPLQNELVIRLQPNEAIYLKTNVKSPGFDSRPIQSELAISYHNQFKNFSTHGSNPDAYTRLIMSVLRNKQHEFVRSDELITSWEIFTPLLHAIEQNPKRFKPTIYEPGSQGPLEEDAFVQEKCGSIVDQIDAKMRSKIPSFLSRL